MDDLIKKSATDLRGAGPQRHIYYSIKRKKRKGIFDKDIGTYRELNELLSTTKSSLLDIVKRVERMLDVRSTRFTEVLQFQSIRVSPFSQQAASLAW